MKCNGPGIVFSLLVSALAPFANAQTQAPTSGLLISRDGAEGWQVRLIAGSTAHEFTGVIESSGGFDSFNSAKLETPDSATLVTPNQLSTNFIVWPGGTDGVDFWAPATANICLRDSSNSGVEIYLGDSLANAIPVTSPVPLSGSDACGTGGGSSALAAPPAGTRKYHTGHYVALLRGSDSLKVIEAAKKPGVVGFSKRYTWRSFESSQGVYDFSEVRTDLNWAAANGMRWVVMIEDKTFVDEKPLPAYLNAYMVRNRPGGWSTIRWNPTVVARYKALVKALGAQFDSNQWFEGIATQESAPGIEDAQLTANGYTPEKYRDALIDMLSTAATSMPKSRVFWYMNFFPRNQKYIAAVADAVASKGVVMGGPDVMPDDHALQNLVYPFYTQFKDKLPLFGQVEPVCYAHEHETSGYSTKYWTMLELYRYARNNLHMNYMFWVYVPNASPRDAYDINDAFPVINANRSLNP